jgi:hypothetical protein
LLIAAVAALPRRTLGLFALQGQKEESKWDVEQFGSEWTRFMDSPSGAKILQEFREKDGSSHLDLLGAYPRDGADGADGKGGGGGDGMQFSFMTESAAVQCLETFHQTAENLQKELLGNRWGASHGVDPSLSDTDYRRLEEYRAAVAEAAVAAAKLSREREEVRVVACFAPKDTEPLAVYQIAVDNSRAREDNVPPTCFVERGFYRLPNSSHTLEDGAEELLSVRSEGLRDFLSDNGLWLVTA